MSRSASSKFYRRVDSIGRMACHLRYGHGGYGIDRGVLDPTVRTAGGPWFYRVFSQCPPRQECLGPQVRCTGLPVVAAVDELWTIVRGVSPGGDICALRAVMRQRATLLAYQTRHIQHMQKALTQMNLQLGHAITDSTELTGQTIIHALVAGERDPNKLAAH